MKIKNGYGLRNVGGDYVVIPLDADLAFNKMMTLNESGKLLWETLEKGADLDALVSALTAEYDVDSATAAKSAEAFIEKLKELELLD